MLPVARLLMWCSPMSEHRKSEATYPSETVWQTLQRIRAENGCHVPCKDAGNCHCNHMLDLELDRDVKDDDGV